MKILFFFIAVFLLPALARSQPLCGDAASGAIRSDSAFFCWETEITPLTFALSINCNDAHFLLFDLFQHEVRVLEVVQQNGDYLCNFAQVDGNGMALSAPGHVQFSLRNKIIFVGEKQR